MLTKSSSSWKCSPCMISSVFFLLHRSFFLPTASSQSSLKPLYFGNCRANPATFLPFWTFRFTFSLFSYSWISHGFNICSLFIMHKISVQTFYWTSSLYIRPPTGVIGWVSYRLQKYMSSVSIPFVHTSSTSV